MWTGIIFNHCVQWHKRTVILLNMLLHLYLIVRLLEAIHGNSHRAFIEIRNHPNGTIFPQMLKFQNSASTQHGMTYLPEEHYGHIWPLESSEISIWNHEFTSSFSLPKFPSDDRGARVARQWGLTKTCAAGTPPSNVFRKLAGLYRTGDQQYDSIQHVYHLVI